MADPIPTESSTLRARVLALANRGPDVREPGSAPRWRVGVGAVVIAVLALLAIGVVFSALSTAGASGSSIETRVDGQDPGRSIAQVSPSSSAPPGPTDATIFVHILGHVTSPGLYEVSSGSRAVDVVTAAGGFSPDAEQGSLNLARAVVDGEQIVVPAVGEQSASAPTAPGSSAASAPGDSGSSVDLNSADLSTLETLPGVGPATAQAILDWRAENGRFQSVEDLLDVTGIGDKKLERLRDAVRVG